MSSRISLLFFLIFGSCLSLDAQVGPPTLTTGIGSIVYQRGELDAELIASIISEKQAEVQTELAQRYILKSLDCGSFTLWNYVRQNLDVLFRESDPDVMTKEILRYGAELALTYGLAEYYLQDLSARSREGRLTPAEEAFLKFYFYWLDEEAKQELGVFLPDEEAALDRCIQEFLGQCSQGFTGDSISFESYVMIFYLEGQEQQIYFQQVPEQDDSFSLTLTPEGRSRLRQMAAGRPEVVGFQLQRAAALQRGPFLPRAELLGALKNTGKPFNEDKPSGLFAAGCGNISPNHILIDLVYEVARNNEAVQRTGFFQQIGVAPEAYESRNKYLLLADELELFLPISEIKEELEDIVDILFKYFKTLQYLREGGLDLSLDNIDILLAEAPDRSVPEVQQAIRDALTSLAGSLKVKYDFEEDERPLLDALLTIIRDRNITPDELDSYAYFIDEELIPQFIELNFSTRGAFDRILREAEDLALVLRAQALMFIREKVATSNVSADIVQFVQLIELLNNLDQVETYEYIFAFLADVGNMTSSPRARTIINAIANGVNRYLVVESEENVLKLEVASFATEVFKRFGERTGSRFAFFFSVGLNNAFAPETVAESLFDSTRHIYYASEKVGVKYKLVDWQRQYAYGDFDLDEETSLERKRRLTRRFAREPVVTDLYAFGALSGLLYQIDVLRSEERFTDPVINLGLGIAFYNNLDLNVSYTVPFGRQFFEQGLINVGLDIKIYEYLTRMRARRQR